MRGLRPATCGGPLRRLAITVPYGTAACLLWSWRRALVLIYLISPAASYQFMEMVEVGGGSSAGWGCDGPGQRTLASCLSPGTPSLCALEPPRPGLAPHPARGMQVSWRVHTCLPRTHPLAPAPAPPAPPLPMRQGHAADTYAEFAEQNRERLQAIPPPLVALAYYKSGDLYLFDQFQTSWKAAGELRRPRCK